MRFFKSFHLLHRRVNSDPGLVRFPNILATPLPHHNLRILDLQAENSHLRSENAALLDELAIARSQLKVARADLFAELHKSVQQTRLHTQEIARLHANQASLDSDAIAQSSSFVVGPRSPNDYMSALHLTLKSRRQLRDCKKSVKFWKHTAKQDPRNLDLVTPSVSNISSVHDILPPERQEAIHALIAKRRASSNLPLAQQQAQTLLEPVSTTLSVPDRPYISSLSPLASQSFRQELSQISSFNRFPSWSSAPNVSRKLYVASTLGHSPVPRGKLKPHLNKVPYVKVCFESRHKLTYSLPNPTSESTHILKMTTYKILSQRMHAILGKTMMTGLLLFPFAIAYHHSLRPSVASWRNHALLIFRGTTQAKKTLHALLNNQTTQIPRHSCPWHRHISPEGETY